MRRALALAARAAGRTSPNPLVGALVVKDGAVVGEGCHLCAGTPHAEVHALAAAGEAARGATIYVTLEPCCHYGRTGPCADALIAAGVKKVVAAMTDPNPKISGSGFKKLRSAGITVVTGVMKREAEKLNSAYLASFKERAPFIILKAAMTLDGKIATRTGDSKWITGTDARAYVHRLRARIDAIMVGITTVLRDDPELTSHGKGRNPVRVIIDPSLKIPMKSRVLDDQAATVIVCGTMADREKMEELRRRKAIVLPVEAKGGRMDFKSIIRRLNGISLYRILIEGGGETISRALSDGIGDQVLFFISPKIIGGRDACTPVEGAGLAKVADAIHLKKWQCRRIGGDILITGEMK
jgi:diaminohydroxyphosphoribosylaminopyrimidine deaminase/5-amino-6-(5-phosphoribosylamino)uracil reductase